MPFTVSHAVVALPFTKRRFAIPASAVAMGAMVPDLAGYLPGFVPFHVQDDFASIPVMVVTGGLLWLAVRFPLQRPLRDLAPRWVSQRLPQREAVAKSRVGGFLLTIIALAVGAISHVVWDAFTHRDAWGLALVPELTSEVTGRALYSWLQDASSLGGLTILALWFLAQPRRDTPWNTQPGIGALRALMWLGIAASACAGVLWGLSTDGTTSRMISVGIRAGSGLAAAVVLVASLLWWLLPKTARESEDARPSRG